MLSCKNHFPLWAHFVIDALCIAIFSVAFYEFYYNLPTELESENIIIERSKDDRSADVSYQEEISGDTNKDESYLYGWALKFPDKFTENVVSTDISYTSPNISVTLTKNTMESGNSVVTYFVADIYIADIEYLQSGFARDTYGRGYAENIEDMSERLGAVIAINGDYYGRSNSGVVIRNGTVYRATPDSTDVCVLYYDGRMETFSPDEFDVDNAIEDSAYQAWSFGPALLDKNGFPLTEFNSSVTPLNPRTVFGYYEPGHYCFVVVDGRQTGYSRGMTMSELSILMNKLGCRAAYNLDGGQSSLMTMYGKIVNQPYKNGRAVSDSILIKELE